MKKGDVVRVKPGVQDADFDSELGGWQGRVTEVDRKNNFVTIAWDSHTLRQEMSSEMVTACEEQGLDWAVYGLSMDDVEPGKARDRRSDVQKAVDEIARRHAWDWLGTEDARIPEVLQGIDPEDEAAQFEAWHAYLQEHLTLPFEAEVYEFQERGPLQAGDRVRVEQLLFVDIPYGSIVRLQRRRRRYDFPLCDLDALDEDSENHKVVEAYRIWYANR